MSEYRRFTIDSLPDSILRVIFLHCKESKQSTALTVSYHLARQTSPLCLSYVCSRWRKILLATPAFWSHIRVLVVQPRKSIEILNTLLQRSASHPLQVVFDCRPRGWHHQLSQQHESDVLYRIGLIMDALIVHFSRLRHLLVKADSVEQLNPVISRLKYTCVPVLESFRMFVIKTEVLCGRLFLGGAPMLRSVMLGGVHRPWKSQLLHNLSSLDLQFEHRSEVISVSELQGVFDASPRLTHLSLSRVQLVLNPSVEHQMPRTSMSLRTLKLYATDTLPSFLNFIDAPKLCDLYLGQFSHLQLSPAIQALCAQQLFSLKYPNLKHLCISGIDDPLFHPSPLLTAFPTIVHLTLQRLDVQPYADVLGGRESIRPPCHLLQTLTVDYVGTRSSLTVSDLLFILVKRRLEMGAPLRSLRTDFLGMCFDIKSPLFSFDMGRFKELIGVEFHWNLLEGERSDFQSALDEDFHGDSVKSVEGGPEYYYEKDDKRCLQG